MDDDVTPDQPHSAESDHGARIVLLVPKAHVKAVKMALEKHKLFDRQHGISPDARDAPTGRMRIHTTIQYTGRKDESVSNTNEVAQLKNLCLHDISPDITLSLWTPSSSPNPTTQSSNNPLRKALHSALSSLPPSTLDTLPSIEFLTTTFPDAYSIYTPLLLLPGTSLPPHWHTLLHTHATLLEPIWSHIAAALGCTHIALNAPIPASNTTSGAHASDASNILRSPVNLVPLYGDFGPGVTAERLQAPREEDFKTALWVEARQNGVRQTWAPVYTMFSRGNVKEKARILHLPSLPRNRDKKTMVSAAQTRTGSAAAKAEDAEAGGARVGAAEQDMTALDFYAGIGYFSLPYALAGCRPVLCWELNPWSIEALRRNCILNKLSYRLFTPSCIPSVSATDDEWNAWATDVARGGEVVWIFAMGNETAARIIGALRDRVPAVGHVNLGLLPVSRLSWPSAVGAVDCRRGGWVHAHENVGVEEMDERRREVEREFQRLVDECGGEVRRVARVEHVERVKMYAPGVVHAVFDVCLPGTKTDE